MHVSPACRAKRQIADARSMLDCVLHCHFHLCCWHCNWSHKIKLEPIHTTFDVLQITMNPYLRNASLGISLLLTYVTGANANATEYFPKLTADEKDEFTNFVNDRSSSYPRHSFLPSAEDPEDGVAVFWKLDEDKVHFAVAARAEGWLGFGLSEAGGRSALMLPYLRHPSHLSLLIRTSSPTTPSPSLMIAKIGYWKEHPPRARMVGSL